ncbi:MAG: alpha-L-glutamate ligase-like protein [Cellvibrionaceae bacterium]|nr:alpha-L-glutamate ligase-like protein [Cellvibrionaceae bacterium]
MNRRNICYISRYNPRYLFPLVDNKLKTKQMALEYGVQVPDLISVVDSQHRVGDFGEAVLGTEGFCIKPAKGSGGKGILVITKVEGETYFRSNGQAMSITEIRRHMSNVLAGLFSLGGAMDVALVESLIKFDPSLQCYSYEGVPDVRVIVFRGIPVMAMMRLSCAESNGKANLHQGAIGVGLDIATGCAVRAVQHDREVTLHPDTKKSLADLKVPAWQQLLELACACYDMSGLGYLGVDLVLDADRGPILLELNARPGLSIQIANGAGLLPRLRLVESLKKVERMRIDQRIGYAQANFAQT